MADSRDAGATPWSNWISVGVGSQKGEQKAWLFTLWMLGVSGKISISPIFLLEHLEEVVRWTSCNTQQVECWSLLRAEKLDGTCSVWWASNWTTAVLLTNSRRSQSREDFSEETICYMYMVCTCLWSCMRESSLCFCMCAAHICVGLGPATRAWST